MGRDPLHFKDFSGRSVWDLKQTQNGQFGLASIYDGYIFDLEKKETNLPVE